MMSLQVIAVCYMLFMLAVPTTIYLLMTFSKQVKPPKNKTYKFEALSLQKTFGTEEEADAKTSGVTTPNYDLLYRLQQELETLDHSLLRKPFRSRKRDAGKSKRHLGRRLKPEWVRKK